MTAILIVGTLIDKVFRRESEEYYIGNILIPDGGISKVTNKLSNYKITKELPEPLEAIGLHWIGVKIVQDRLGLVAEDKIEEAKKACLEAFRELGLDEEIYLFLIDIN